MAAEDNKNTIEEWYAAFDTDRKDLEVFRDLKHEETVRLRLLNRIVANIPEARPTPQLLLFRPANLMRVAAVLALCLLSIPIYQYLRDHSKQPIDVQMASSKAKIGKMLSVTLADGSEVLLNSGSELRYPAHFNEKQRVVYLKGEAFFKVKHRTQQPFIVATGKLKTVVLGTSFNVRAYPELDRIAVNVATGKVGVSAAGKTLALLSPNQQINVQPSSGHFEVLEFNSRLARSWENGTVRLDGASFKELSLLIKNTWGLRLETNSERIAATNFKTTFHTNNQITEVMKAISKMTDAKYRIRDQIITLYE